MSRRGFLWSITLVIAVGTLVAVHGFANAASLLDEVNKNGKVIIGVRHSSPPFGFINKKGEVDGFGVDIAKEIAKALGVKLEMRESTAATRIPLVQTGAVHMTIGPTMISKKRMKSVDFSIPYYMDRRGNRMLVPKDSNINGYEKLAGKTVAIVQGSFAKVRLERNAPKAKLLILQDYPALLLAVKSGQANALFANDFVIQDMLKKNPGKFRATPLLHELQLIGIVLRQNDSKWKDAVDFAIHDLWHSGRYHEIYRKHFGKDPDPDFFVPQWQF
jgi:polar amino acid transport system substrate-binding protein